MANVAQTHPYNSVCFPLGRGHFPTKSLCLAQLQGSLAVLMDCLDLEEGT